MSWKYKIQESFEKNSKIALASLKVGEDLSLSLAAEDSQFVRVNKAQVRQTTAVEQAQVNLILQTSRKLSKFNFPMTGNLEEDRKRFLFYVGKARQELDMLPENPFPIHIPQSGTSFYDGKSETPEAEFFVEKLKTDAPQDDFVGYMASGPLIRAITNSKGAYHWHSQDFYFVDYSLFSGTQGQAKAVTDIVSGKQWDEEAWKLSLNQSRAFLHQMQKPSRSVERGDYRVYLAPAAVAELLEICGWGGFSQAAFRQGQCGLRQLVMGEKPFSEKFTLVDNFQMGLYPQFNTSGEVYPKTIPLIEKGQHKNLLTSSKTAAEFNLESNGADEMETPKTLELSPGKLAREDIFKKLDTGLYLSNLHYVNWSDQKTARMTGMTRFACFWVENGDIVSPINDMRFDVSLYDIWGSELIDLTQFQNTMVNKSTYYSRGFGGSKLPGMLIQKFKFTL